LNEDEAKNTHLAENLFGEESTQSGRIGWNTIKSVFDKLGGTFMFVIIYLCFQAFMLMNVFTNGYIIAWSKDFRSPDCWSNFRFLVWILA